jgi:cobalt/nickel transport system ATP-binding protein
VNPVLSVEKLCFSYGSGRPVLDSVSFEIAPRESVVLLGPNGSGKTTLLLHLNGILKGKGRVMVGGVPVEPPHLAAIRRRVGFLFQDPGDQLFLPSVLEDVMFAPLQAGSAPDAAEALARESLRQVGIEHLARNAPYALSAGEKQRAAMAGILATSPELIVLDEPTTHLDPPARRSLIELLQSLPQARLVATHDAAFARAVSNRALFLERGRLSCDGPTPEVLSRFSWEL